ncbi:MAG: hypothetical protein HRU41_17855 [Saprospiraceae bacterium]|nr:hypothetical protein [Saprospiraceae bacterium]
MSQKSSLLSLIVLAIFGSSCELINPAEDIPAFLYIEPFTFEVNPAAHGSASADITEVWVTVDGDFLGVYPLPANVPVLAEGRANVRLEAGIHDNGIRATPNIYPFYEAFVREVELGPNETDTLRPTTTYRSNARFAFIENFETGSRVFTEQFEGQNGLTSTNDIIFEGNQSGLITLTQSDDFIQLGSEQIYAGLTDNSPRVYLEMDYRSEVPVVWGVLGFTSTGPGEPILQPGFRESNDWNKIYFDLSLLILQGNFSGHRILLQANLPNGSSLEEAKVYLDNIKLLHF